MSQGFPTGLQDVSPAGGGQDNAARRFTRWATAFGLAVLGGVLSSCGQAQPPAEHTGSVQIAGSETMRPVVAACAEAFMTTNPEADIIVTGGGSGDGIAALLHGIVDVGMTSRELSAREREYATSTGIDLSMVPLALDGIAIVVNSANAVATLDLGQVRSAFTGKAKNWRDLGGADREITVFARAAGSGTATLFGERALGEEPLAPSARTLPTNEAIVAEVAGQPGAIGYTGLGAIRTAGDRVKVLALRTDAQPTPVAPTPETIRSKTYPLARTLYLAAGAPAGTVKAFLDFCSSTSGHALLQRAGYVGIDH